MERMFATFESTMNKSSINDFRKFINKFSDVTKWIMCSDYCLDDKNKANNVISFVIYPYILDINQWGQVIESMQKKDLKHSRSVSDEFCKFTKKGYFFSFNFIIGNDCCLEKWKDKATLDKLINDYIDMTNLWQETTPKNSKTYEEMNSKLKKLQNESKRKNFNYKLLGRIVMVTFLAGYLKYLLYRECKSVELFSWLSDRDSITNWQNEIYQVIYHLISHCLCTNHLKCNCNKGEELFLQDIANESFYDPLNRVCDYICGGIADYNYEDKTVTSEKQCKLIEEVISGNNFIIILGIKDNNIFRISHKRV